MPRKQGRVGRRELCFQPPPPITTCLRDSRLHPQTPPWPLGCWKPHSMPAQGSWAHRMGHRSCQGPSVPAEHLAPGRFHCQGLQDSHLSPSLT